MFKIINSITALTRYNCSAHLLNTVLRNTFNFKTFILNIQPIIEIIDKVKKTVTYLKQSGKVAQLEKTVLQDIETRWNSKCMMLKSVYE